MRVLLIQAKSIQKEDAPVLPLGLCYLATALAAHNHEINAYDTNTSTDPISELKRLILSSEPEIIGISLRNIDNALYTAYHNYFHPFSELVSIIKETAPESKILAGGPGFSIFAQRLMELVPGIDYGIFSEGEEAMPDLINNLDRPQSVKGIFHRHNGSVLFTGAREPVDFASFPAPRRDFLDLTPYLKHNTSIGIQTKRGCPFKCSYCTYPYIEGAKYRIRPPEAVIDEIEELVREYDMRSFFFVDSIFNVPPSHASKILEGMLARGLNLRWGCYEELKYIDEEYVKLAKDTGHVDFEFAPDGISRSTLNGLNKETSREDIERVYSICKKNDHIKVAFSFFINGPGESFANIFRLIFFLIRCKLFLRKKVIITYPHLIRIYPNTQLYNMALEKGLLKPGDDIIQAVFYNPPPFKYIVNILRPIVKTVRFIFRILTGRIFRSND
jgi:anaerobic magnesium-protoporphyrin IX monomethyl ester cyclase